MKRRLIHLLLMIVLVGTILAPAALAQRRHWDTEAVRVCNQTFREAKRAAQRLPRRQRRIRLDEIHREHGACLRRARR
jgi:hypothetical protein